MTVTKIRAFFTTRTGRLVLQDAGLFAAAFTSTGVLASSHLTIDVIISALITAAKVTVRKLLPAPPRPTS